MAIYQLTIQKSVIGYYWTNVYFVERADFASASAAAEEIAEAEKSIHLGYVAFVSARVSLAGFENPNQYVIVPLQGSGARVTDGSVPLTICWRALLVKGPTAPDVKYLRGVTKRSDFASVGTYTGAAVAELEAAYADALGDVAGLCSKVGVPITDVQMSPKIAQHQQTRGTRKRTQPVIPVS